MNRLAQISAAAAIAITAAACGGSNAASTVTAPTAGPIVTETFTGTLNPPVGGVFQANSHTFTVATGGGNINITLLSAGPPSTIQLGLALGNPSSTGACAIIAGFVVPSTPAGSTAQLPATGAPAGAYCVVVADVGNVLQPVTYTVTVAHS